MKISAQELAVIKSVNKALDSSENYNADGSINWDFVDADVYMDINPADADVDAHYEMFNRFASAVEASIAA